MRSQTRWVLDELTAGTGLVESLRDQTFALKIGPQTSGYGLAQVDDYHRLARDDFQWEPPLKLQVKARASTNNPLGTLGFGFWNDPFSVRFGQSGAARRFPTAPQALWFFYGSPPNEIVLDPPVPGSGWKAAALRSPRIPAPVLAPAAFAAIIASRIPILRRFVMQAALGTVRAEEAILNYALDQAHEYELVWDDRSACFLVDGEKVLQTDITPQPPVGFVSWIDNQFAIASPEGGFHFGVVPTKEAQTLLITQLEINGLRPSTTEEDVA